MLNFLGKSISKIFGTKSDKDVKMLTPYVVATNAAFELLHELSNDDFRAKTQELKDHINDYLAPIRDEITEIQKEIDENQELNILQKEASFKRIDELRASEKC